jgi:hypothetical protein
MVRTGKIVVLGSVSKKFETVFDDIAPPATTPAEYCAISISLGQ